MLNSKLYSEIYATIVAMGEDYIKRIPTDFFEFVEKERDINYEVIIDQNKALNEQGLAKETVAMMAKLKLDYWCETDEEKQELLNLLQTNEMKIKEELAKATNTRDLLRMLHNKT